MIHRFIELLGGTKGPAFEVVNRDGSDEWSDCWVVDRGAGSATQVTDNSATVFTYNSSNRLSPDETKIAFVYNDASVTDRLYVMDVDGSNQTQLTTAQVSDPQWLGSTTILYETSGTIRRIDTDGTNAATLLSGAGLDIWQLAPDDSLVAYTLNASTDGELWVMDTDGTNKTQIATGLGVVAAFGGPVWKTDSSQIVFPNGAGMDQIDPDGTNQTTIEATMPNGFWWHLGMFSDRLFTTDTSNAPTFWQMGNVIFTSGYSVVSPALYVAQSGGISRSTPVAAQGRVFTVKDGSQYSSTSDLVSVSTDGTGLRMAFVPDESNSPLFQTVYTR